MNQHDPTPITIEEAARRGRLMLGEVTDPGAGPNAAVTPAEALPPKNKFSEGVEAMLKKRDATVKAYLVLTELSKRPDYAAKDAVALLEADGFSPDIAQAAVEMLNDELDRDIPKADAHHKKESAAQKLERLTCDYYDGQRKEYLVKNSEGSWLSYNEGQYKRILRNRGASGECGKKERVSEIDRVILDTQDRRFVVYSGQLAGWRTGVHQTNVGRILVTVGPTIIEPEPGDMTALWTFLETLLGSTPEQLPTFLGWLKLSYECLRANSTRPGQALVIAGPGDCGKSLLQHIITRALGGRFARPYAYMAGKTEFNSDLFAGEHLTVEDDVASTKLTDRRAFGSKIKEITANSGQRLHAKGRDAVMLPVYWRISVTVNDEPENLMILPPMDESLEDKIIVFRAMRATLPCDPGIPGGYDKCLTTLLNQVPQLLAYLSTWTIPDECVARRYGTKAYHHPDIMRVIADLAPESRLLELIEAEIFRDSQMTWTGTASELESRLLSSQTNGYEARRLLSWPTACGTYLGRLAKKHPLRFSNMHTKDGNEWSIAPASVAFKDEF